MLSFAQKIYNYLRKADMTKDGALGVMGNLQAESGLYPCRLQGDYRTGFETSKLYAEKVDSGEISKYNFCHDAKGWGLAQWTYWSRKQMLYDMAKQRGVSIANLDLQLDLLIRELKESYAGLWNYLCLTNDLYTATSRVCTEFERPYYNNIDVRYQFAKTLENEITEEPEDETPKSEYWPPRMIDRNMSGADVEVLQAILKARGYAINYVSGKFDDLLTTELKRFQKDHNLSADGVCGNKTWAEILKI